MKEYKVLKAFSEGDLEVSLNKMAFEGWEVLQIFTRENQVTSTGRIDKFFSVIFQRNKVAN